MAASDKQGSDQERPRRNGGSRDQSEKVETPRDGDNKPQWTRRETVWRSRGEGKSEEGRREEGSERPAPREGFSRDNAGREGGGFQDGGARREGSAWRDRESGGSRESGGFRDRESSGPRRDFGGGGSRESGGFRDRESGGPRRDFGGGGSREGGGFRDRESGGPRRDFGGGSSREGGGFRDRESSGPRRDFGGGGGRESGGFRDRSTSHQDDRGAPRRDFGGPRFAREMGPRIREREDGPRGEEGAARRDRESFVREDRRDDRERRPYRAPAPYAARYGGGSRFRMPRQPLKKKKKVRVFFHQALTRILLPKLLTKAKYLSPRLAKHFIETGRVRVNARIVSSPYYEVNLRKERVTIDEAATEYPRRLCYMVYNKTRSVVCEKGDAGFDEIFEPESIWSFPFGRLTKSASGLVILSNDPRMIKRQHTVDIELQKEYRVKLNKTLTEEQLDELRLGVLVGDEYLVPLRVNPVRENKNSMWIDITLLDDSYQRLYGAFKALGAEVLALRRTRIALINEAMVPPGEWRELSGFEIAALGLPKFMPGELPPEPILPMKPRPERKPPFKKDGRDNFRRGGERGGGSGSWDRRAPGPPGRRPPHGGFRAREDDFEDRQREEAEADAIGNK